MSEVPLITLAIIAILVLVGIILLAVVWKRRREGEQGEPDYRAFFTMGIAWLSAGIVIMIISLLLDIPFVVGLPLSIMGVVYLILGLSNRDKWKAG